MSGNVFIINGFFLVFFDKNLIFLLLYDLFNE